MTQNLFLRIDGVEGECGVDGRRGDIQVLSWSHSFNQPTSPTRAATGGGSVEQANHADFSFTKHLDTASVPLMKLCWTGKTVPSAVFTACRADGDALVEYLKVEMTGLIVSNVSVGGGPGDQPTETITLSYGKVRYTYSAQAVPSRGATPSAEHDLTRQMVG